MLTQGRRHFTTRAESTDLRAPREHCGLEVYPLGDRCVPVSCSRHKRWGQETLGNSPPLDGAVAQFRPSEHPRTSHPHTAHRDAEIAGFPGQICSRWREKEVRSRARSRHKCPTCTARVSILTGGARREISPHEPRPRPTAASIASRTSPGTDSQGDREDPQNT